MVGRKFFNSWDASLLAHSAPSTPPAPASSSSSASPPPRPSRCRVLLSRRPVIVDRCSPPTLQLRCSVQREVRGNARLIRRARQIVPIGRGVFRHDTLTVRVQRHIDGREGAVIRDGDFPLFPPVPSPAMDEEEDDDDEEEGEEEEIRSFLIPNVDVSDAA